MKIAADKWKHFFVGIAMGMVLQAAILFLFPAHEWLSVFLALFISIVISYGFELFSKFTGMGVYEVMDAVASVLGAILGMGAVWLKIWISTW